MIALAFFYHLPASLFSQAVGPVPSTASADQETPGGPVSLALAVNLPARSPRAQVGCDPEHCTVLELKKETGVEIGTLMDQNAGEILVDAGAGGVELSDENLQPLRAYLRGVAEREGRVSVEPVYVAERAASPLFVKDVISVSWSIFSWIHDSVVYRQTKRYHGKVIYHPVTGRILLVNFVHRQYGDICSTLISRCDVIEYVDEKTFDLTLERRLRENHNAGKPVRVVFGSAPATLPGGELTLENLSAMNRSTRIYKWLVAARRAEKKPLHRERFIAVPAAVALIDISIMAYNVIRDLAMYSAAAGTDAEVLYTGALEGGAIQSVVFVPVAEK